MRRVRTHTHTHTHTHDTIRHDTHTLWRSRVVSVTTLRWRTQVWVVLDFVRLLLLHPVANRFLMDEDKARSAAGKDPHHEVYDQLVFEGFGEDVLLVSRVRVRVRVRV